MKQTFQDKSILIVGATGGLGNAAAQAFSSAGARLFLAGRDAEKLQQLRQQFSVPIFQVDITNPQSVEALKNSVTHVDVVVNLTGADVRKPLDSHSIEEIQRLVAVNLTGSIYLTRAFLPQMKTQQSGIILHVGGFADGRLAFPYYSADVATRAGLFSFVESLNRELQMEKSQVVITYFSPSAADTKAEQPFHPIWREMGLTITSTEQVAAALLNAIEKRKQVYIMGGASAVLFAKLNSISPRLADGLLLNRYGRILKRFLADESKTAPSLKSSRAIWFGIGLIVLSFLLYGGLLVLPFLPITIESKLALSPILVILGEVSFWVGGLVVGKQVIMRYKRYLNPRYWLSCCQPSSTGTEQK